ncbi:protein GDAP2 homolog [Uloborus diversus]|uniref:protein GDAP2 homolog n=1 Tax=Uloborus diversus TaxID=327109 RepID=UPI0024097DF1|nr:protein GDAP2 homolog [Uloborus diversus]XP_054721465.1 protein GDAP2 homolog [Uloborus diversus]
MDPLGISPEIVDASSLKRWSEISPRDLPDSSNFGNQEKVHDVSPFPFKSEINSKVALWAGDICSLRIQVIVHSTNEALTDRSPLNDRLIKRAGLQLKDDLISNVKACRTGEAKLTKGYNLPARYVIHTVGPKFNVKYQTAAESALFSCYFKVLQLVKEHNLGSVGLCVINSLRRNYPPHDGAHIALRTVRRFLEKYGDTVDMVVFAVEDVDVGIYELLMPLYYPRSKDEEEYACFNLPRDIGGENGEPFIPERQMRIVERPFHALDEVEESVDLAAELESSVCIGKTAFAKMHGDLDRHKNSTAKSTVDILTSEVTRKTRYERLLRKARNEDLRSIANLGCLYHSGEDRYGRPVVVFIGERFKVNQLDLNKAVMYLVLTLDSIVQKDYIVVYFHTLTTNENNPSLSFLKDVYSILEYKYKKNLRAFYIVHPTFWSRLMAWWFTTFTASSIKNKVQLLGGVEYLYHLIPPDQLEIPSFILDYDYKVNGIRYCQPTQSSTS